MYTKNIFRNHIPVDFINQFVKIFHLQNLRDTSEFTKHNVKLELYYELLPTLLIYYLPCKFKFLENASTSPQGMITIFRQLLRSQNLYLKKNYKVVHKNKTTYYYIYNPISSVVKIRRNVRLQF